jgi:hypothetical protein
MSDKSLMQSMETHSSPIRGLLLAMALAVALIFVLPIIVLKAVRSAPQAPTPVVSAPVSRVLPQPNESLPKPQPPPPELMQYP